MSKNKTTKLTKQGQLNLVKILTKPSKPTEEMKKLRSLPRLEVR